MGADAGEVAEVDGRDRKDRQPLAHRDHRGVGPGRRPAQRRTSAAVRRRSAPVNPASWKASASPMPALSGKAASAAGPGYLSIRWQASAATAGGTSRTSSLPRNHAAHSAWCLSRRSASAYKTLVSTTMTSSAGYRPKPSASSSPARSDTSVRRLSSAPVNAGQARDARRSGSSPAGGSSNPGAREACSSCSATGAMLHWAA